MAYTVTQFREETVAAYERDYSILRVGCIQEHMTNGNQATFLVAGSGNNRATTRGVNGQIAYQTPDRNQSTVTLKEAHGTSEETRFDMFQSQGNQISIMQKDAITQLNVDIDDDIIAQLDTFTLTTGSPQTASLAMVNKALAILGNNNVKTDQADKMFAAITPGFHAYLMAIPEFTRSDYVDVKPFEGPARKMRRWAGVQWMLHTGLTGIGTADEYCVMWHQDAMGHAADLPTEKIEADYDKKQDSSWCRASLFHGAKKIQNVGGIIMRHDGSAFAG